MTEDFFALLGEPRRPWLDAERIKDTFHRLSRTEHPDQQSAEDADFARLNQAQATLREPKGRLRHLLELEYPAIRLSGPTSVPPDLTNLFVPVHALLSETDALLAKKANASSALAKALLSRNELTVREKVEGLLERIDALHAAALEELRTFDALWDGPRQPEAAVRLHDLYQRFAYLSRWTEQLRERLFQLGI